MAYYIQGIRGEKLRLKPNKVVFLGREAKDRELEKSLNGRKLNIPTLVRGGKMKVSRVHVAVMLKKQLFGKPKLLVLGAGAYGSVIVKGFSDATTIEAPHLSEITAFQEIGDIRDRVKKLTRSNVSKGREIELNGEVLIGKLTEQKIYSYKFIEEKEGRLRKWTQSWMEKLSRRRPSRK